MKQSGPAQLTSIGVFGQLAGAAVSRQVAPPSEVVDIVVWRQELTTMQCSASPQDHWPIEDLGSSTGAGAVQVCPPSADRMVAIRSVVAVPPGASPTHLPSGSHRSSARPAGAPGGSRLTGSRSGRRR